jgi:hypothetical protein
MPMQTSFGDLAVRAEKLSEDTFCHGLSLSFPMSNPRLTFGEMRLPILH